MLLLDDAARQGQTDTPPARLVETPGSNRLARTSGATPGPSSHTAMRAVRGAASTVTSILPPRPESASMAFLITASSAHSTSTGSPRRWARPGGAQRQCHRAREVGSRGRK